MFGDILDPLPYIFCSNSSNLRNSYVIPRIWCSLVINQLTLSEKYYQKDVLPQENIAKLFWDYHFWLYIRCATVQLLF